MPIWCVAAVNEQPEIILCDWRVVQIEDGSRHFVGYNVVDREGRVSTDIVKFDPETMIGVTRSGRAYLLQGDPGCHPDADATWDGWAALNKVQSATDVTETAKRGK